MNYLIAKEVIKLMSKLEDGTIIKNDKGLPISAVLCDLDGNNNLKIDYNIRTTISFNVYKKEFMDESKRYMAHAEYRLLEEWHSLGKELNNFVIIVTIPPCKKCLQVIKELKIKKVYYLYCNDKKHAHKFKHYKDIGLDDGYIEHLNLNDYSNEKDIEKVRQKKNIAIEKIKNYLWWMNK